MVLDVILAAAEGVDAATSWLTGPHAIVVTLIVSMFTFLGTLATGGFAYMSNRNARAANRAVNHAPEGEDRLFDMVYQIRANVADNTLAIMALASWQEQWSKLPPHLSTAERVAGTMSSLAYRIDLVGHALDEIVPRRPGDTANVWTRIERLHQ